VSSDGFSPPLGLGVEVPAGGGERGVTEDVSQFDDVGAVLDRLRGERVAQGVHRRSLGHGGTQPRPPVDPPSRYWIRPRVSRVPSALACGKRRRGR
jgi:hypothetical protein